MAKDEISAYLGPGTTFEGKLSFGGTVRIDGTFVGEVSTDGSLVVGKGARLVGSFQVATMIISGQVEGEVRATDKAVLYKTASFAGRLRTEALVVEEGAVVEGDVAMVGDRKPVAEAGPAMIAGAGEDGPEKVKY